MLKNIILLVLFINCCNGQLYFLVNNHFSDLKEVFSWKQIGYDFNGVQYTNDTAREKKADSAVLEDGVDEKEMFFNQYNNVPFGLDVCQDRVFIAVARRRTGIPSTLNYVDVKDSSPLLKPYPSVDSISSLVSVYRPRVDACGRLWVVDTGILEIPDARTQIKAPHIVVFDLETDKEILRYEIPSEVIGDGGNNTFGLISITVDVTPSTCDDAYAYIADITGGLIVFSMKQLSTWRFTHSSFNHDVGAVYMKIAGHEINWIDGLFSVALSDPDSTGKRTAYYHPFISTQEFSVDTDTLKNKSADFSNNYKLEGVRGAWSQSGAHAYHSGTKTLLYANVAQDGIMCWNTQIPLTSKTSGLVAIDHSKLVYISDLKIVGDELWVLVNRMPEFLYGTINPLTTNYYVYKGYVQDLIKGTVCDEKI